ncbi:MAG: SpoIIE family protein phosphatase [Bacteroidetes bacterium]|nr:SpoIIE family protein phosphatase [Bacteroidota bacterium]
MNKQKIILNIIAILTILSNTFLFAQQRTKTEANADIVEYTIKEGLPTTNISNFVQTKDGYIWLSGIEGTYRFDGYDFDEVGEKYGVPDMQNMYYDSTKNILYFASPKKFITFNGKEFKVYDENDGYKINGLEGQLITFINKDKRNRIWIGSSTPFIDKKYNGGLTKFENGKFTVYDSTTFPLHNASGFLETPYGDLIFKSNGKNTQTKDGSYIALYKNDVFKKIGPEEGVYLQNANIFDQNVTTSIDKKGNTWIAFTGVNSEFAITTKNPKKTYGVLMYDGNKFHQFPELTKMLGNKQLPIMAYYSKEQNKVFVSTFTINPKPFSSKNKSIFEYSNGKWSYSNFFKDVKYVKNLKTNKLLKDFKYTVPIFTKTNKLFHELLIFLSTTTTDQIISSKYPNQFYTHKNGKWEKYDAFKFMPVKSLKDGHMVTNNKGFGIYYPNKSKMLTKKDGLLRATVGIPNLYSDRNGIVWISYSYSALPAYANVDNTGVNIWDGKNLIKYTEKDGLKSNITFNTYQDSKYRVWITTSKGITVAREIKNSDGNWLFKFKNIKSNSKKDYNVTNVMETKKGEIYTWQNYVRTKYGKMVKANFYLGKFDGNKFKEIKSPFSKKENNKKYQLISLREGLDGKLWIEGLFADEIKSLTSVPSKILLYDGKKWSAPPKSWNVPKEQLHYVGTLNNGMYFLTVGGFYNFDGSKFVNLSDSVDTNADFRILKGASVTGTQTEIHTKDRLYIRLRNRGLVIFDGTHLNFYTIKNGLPSANISNPGVDEKGNVTFGFPSGALVVKGEKFQAYYDDENIVTGGPIAAVKDINKNLIMLYNGVGLYINKKENKSYHLKITSVSIDTNSYYYKYPQDLNHTQNSFFFEFAALNYKDPKQTKYEHFLEGYDKDWSRPGNLAFTEYQNLPPGNYTFKVRGITSNGIKTNEATYSFVINPPIWLTWWAYILYFIFIGLVLFSFRKYEKTRIEKKEELKLEKEREKIRLKEVELRAEIAEKENERKSKELEEARQLQLSMLPKELPNIPNLDIAVYMQTATEVGGDYYDFHVGMDGTLTVVIGDATGHGLNAGTIVTATKSLFNSYASNPDILFTFSEISRCIKGLKFKRLSMCLSLLKIEGNNLRMSAAGMPPALIYRNDKKEIEEIMLKGMPLGATDKFPYELSETTLGTGDTILLSSDGFPELFNDKKEMFGYDRVKTTFSEVADRSSEKIIEHLKNTASEWIDGKDPDDDVTFVVLKMK